MKPAVHLSYSGSTYSLDLPVDVVVGDDVAACRAPIKARLALYIGSMGARERNFYNQLACRYGYEEAAKTVQDLYLAGRKADAEAAVPDRLVDDVAALRVMAELVL